MNSWFIAHNTFREAIRDRVLAGVVGAGVVLLVATQLLQTLALGEGSRLTVDLGLTAISVLGLLVVLIVGTSLVAKEIERRTIFNLLSRPITRNAYLVGKWAGLSLALWSVTLTLGVALTVLLLARGDILLIPGVLHGIYMAGLELTLVTAMAVMFSALSTPVLSALYTLGFYAVGQWSDDLRVFASKFPAILATTMEVLANLVPNLPLFNVRALAAAGEIASMTHMGIATLYAVLYAGCVLCLATAAFHSRDFK